MSTRTIRPALALMTLLVVLHLPRPAAADVTISGTVGEIVAQKVSTSNWIFRFKLTDLNQTKTCTTFAGYAFFVAATDGTYNSLDLLWREWYSMLLVSKKGAPISCVLENNTICRVKECGLP